MCLTQRGKLALVHEAERERMKAVLRLGLAIAAAWLGLAGTPALAQSVPAATTNTPAADSIGPPQLQNFNLQGTVTRRAEPVPAEEAARPAATAAPSARQTPSTDSASASARAAAPPRAGAGSPSTASEPVRQRQIARARPELPVAPAAVPTADGQQASPVPAQAFSEAADVAPPSLVPERSLPLWPWLLAALALGAGGAFLFWRRSAREAYAGGPQVDAFVAPEPAPLPRPAPAPKAAPPRPAGIVSTALRPWIDISFTPVRCIVEDEGVTFEFEVELLNSGGAPARDVLVEANIFNASPTQDQELGRFFGNPTAKGDSIPALPPLQRVGIRPQVSVPLDQVRILEAGGRRVFVPLIAFNAVYRWGQGAGQTSAAYLLGRDTKGEKLAPFRLDLGPRVFRGLGARTLPAAVRT
jgi:hypothetical protein